MCYTLRDPVSAGTFPTAVEKKPRGKAQRMEIKSRCFDACLVIDGSLSYKFNDGTRAIVSIHDEDVLRTVHIYSSDIWKKESTWISFPIPYSFLNFRLGKARLFLKECIIFLNLKFEMDEIENNDLESVIWEDSFKQKAEISNVSLHPADKKPFLAINNQEITSYRNAINWFWHYSRTNF